MKTIFLLGAGASRPAGIPTIDKMTKEFLEAFPKNRIKKYVIPIMKTLSKIAIDQFGKEDLETLMSVLVSIENKNYKNLLARKFPKINEKRNEYFLEHLKQEIRDFIRKKCENIRTVDYFAPLQGLKPPNDPLNIFTLNYDGTIEIFCEKNNIPYVDGFNPKWEPEDFDKNKGGVNLFKLHGSLYWFRRESGKYFKVPIKGLHIFNIKYLTDESVSEMMIYPQLAKDKESAVYSTLSHRFKDALSKSEICVIIGYSFRDEDIRKNIIEYLSLNPKLWLVIVSPHADMAKNSHFSKNNEFATRVVSMNMGIENALQMGRLNDFLSRIDNARSKEETATSAQLNTSSRLDMDWIFILRNYLMIEHNDKIKSLVEKLLTQKFTNIGSFPDSIEGVVGFKSLQYALDYGSHKTKGQMEFWKKLFVEFCTVVENQCFILSGVPNADEMNPVKKEDLPNWYRSQGVIPIEQIQQLKTEVERIQKNIVNKGLKTKLEKLSQTLDILSAWLRGEFNKKPISEFADAYKTDLGLKKWATEIMNSS